MKTSRGSSRHFLQSLGTSTPKLIRIGVGCSLSTGKNSTTWWPRLRTYRGSSRGLRTILRSRRSYEKCGRTWLWRHQFGTSCSRRSTHRSRVACKYRAICFGSCGQAQTARVSAIATGREHPQSFLRRRGVNQIQSGKQKRQIQEFSDNLLETNSAPNVDTHRVTKEDSQVVEAGRKQKRASANVVPKVPEPSLAGSQMVFNAHVVTQSLRNESFPSLLTENLIKKAIKEALEEYNGQTQGKSLGQSAPHIEGRLDKESSFFYPYKRRFFKNMGVRDRLIICWQPNILILGCLGSPYGTNRQRSPSLRCLMHTSHCDDEAARRKAVTKVGRRRLPYRRAESHDTASRSIHHLHHRH